MSKKIPDDGGLFSRLPSDAVLSIRPTDGDRKDGRDCSLHCVTSQLAFVRLANQPVEVGTDTAFFQNASQYVGDRRELELFRRTTTMPSPR